MGRKPLEINPECGKRLKQWLEESGHTAQELAKAIYYTPQHLSSVITGRKRMTPDLAEKIAYWARAKQAAAHKNDVGLILYRDMAVRAEWLLCKDDYMTQEDIDAVDEEKVGEAEKADASLASLLREGFEAMGYSLRFDEYVEAPYYDGMLPPGFDELYGRLINTGNGETEAEFPGVEFEQLISQYRDYGKCLAEFFVKRFQPKTRKRVKEGYEKLDNMLKAEKEKEKEEINGKSVGEKE